MDLAHLIRIMLSTLAPHRITQVRVTRHENHEPAILVLDAHVIRRHAALLVSHTLKQCGPAGNLDHLV